MHLCFKAQLLKVKASGLRDNRQFIARHPCSGVQSARLHGAPYHPDKLITGFMAGAEQQDTLVGSNQVHYQSPKLLPTDRLVI